MDAANKDARDERIDTDTQAGAGGYHTFYSAKDGTAGYVFTAYDGKEPLRDSEVDRDVRKKHKSHFWATVTCAATVVVLLFTVTAFVLVLNKYSGKTASNSAVVSPSREVRLSRDTDSDTEQTSFHGLSCVDVTEDNLPMYRYYYGIKEVGVYVVSSRYCRELKNRDRILTVNGVAVNTAEALEAVLAEYQAGDTLTVCVERGREAVDVLLVLHATDEPNYGV